MAIPSGSGTEVLKVAHVAGVTNSENVLINGVANHIYTILSMSVCNTAAVAETFDLYIDDNGGGTDYEILSDQVIGANATFIYSDKLVLSGTDHLCIITASAADIDVVINFIDQDWS
tara:strand:+ start:1435 stop:1785 length:351 start_codon:yes stop_codon:yes gene_type:complete